MVPLKLVVQFAIVFALIGIVSAGHVHVGGLNDEREPDDEVRKVVQSLKAKIEEKAEETYASIEPLKYRKQVVAGTNYFIKAAVTKQGNMKKSYLHLRIYKPFSPQRGPTEVTAILKDIEKEKPLEHF